MQLTLGLGIRLPLINVAHGIYTAIYPLRPNKITINSHWISRYDIHIDLIFRI